MLVYAMVLLVALGLALIVYRYDLYDKEPWHLLVFAAAVGYGFFWGLGYLEDFTNERLGFYHSSSDHTAGQAAVAASYEEAAKLLAVVLVAVLFRRHFNDPMDGLMYGSFAAVGMALEESFYLLRSAAVGDGGALIEVVGCEIIRLVLHILMGGISGFGVGLVVEHARLRYWPVVLAAFLSASMTIHFLWDYVCGIPSQQPTPETELFRRSVAVGLMVVAMGVFGLAVVLGSRLSRARFDPAGEKPGLRWSLFR